MSLDELARPCVHCGLCLPACPTYEATHHEADSPRGRILLLDAFAAGRATADEVRPSIDRCLGCRACETACPSGVPYGELLEEGRARLGGVPFWVRAFLKTVVPSPRLARLAAGVARLSGRAPPAAPAPPFPPPPAAPRARVGIHLGCLTPHLFPSLAADLARVLVRCGYAAAPVADPVCCGALHRHAGLPHPPPALDGHDVVLSAAAGCSATDGLTDACAFLLAEASLPPARLPPVRVAYDAPCHLLHAQGVDASPLLDRIDGVTRVALPDADRCCGAGGLYMEREPALARAVRDRKLDALLALDVDVVATPNPGCHLWLWRGLAERGAVVRVEHPISLWARAIA